jgi:ligand-binding sensor domain-containing protein/DNA-binding CsgD family transcriptional regulator
MKVLPQRILLLILILIASDSHGQMKSIGIPAIVNHSRREYNAGTQNWSVTQRKNGFMYFGNNDGILEYDGVNWTTYPVPNFSVVRSVLAIGDTIYAGAFEEFGFLAPDHEGKLAYNSLNHLVPDEYSGYDEIWKIYENHGKIIFQSYNYIFIFSEGNIKVVEPISRFGMLHPVNNDLYILDADNGLMLLENDNFRIVSDHPVFFQNEIRNILPLDNGEFLIGTSVEGIFLLSKANELIPWYSDVNRKIKENNLYSALKLSNGHLAFGSVKNGIWITNQNGDILKHINRNNGLQNNTILKLYEDRDNNLWLGLDNGIDYLEISSPMTLLNHNYNIESAYTSLVHNGILYVGTNQGLYAREISALEDLHSGEGFRLIPGTEGQVWSLSVVDNTLFCGHNFGCFQIDGFSARQVSDIRGFWSFLVPPAAGDKIIAGTYSGLVTLGKNNGKWTVSDEIKGFNESSRHMHMDNRGNLWISHGYKGLFRVNLNNSLDSVTHSRLFRSESGLPGQLPYNIQVINSEIYITTHSGIFRYDHASDTFSKHGSINEIFVDKGFIDKIHQDNKGNLWYFTSNYLGVMRLIEDGNYIDVISPFAGISDILMPAFQNIYIYDINNAFIGSRNGLIHYASDVIKDYDFPGKVFIREATFYGKQKEPLSLFTSSISKLKNSQVLPYNSNSVVFRFTAPAFERPERVHFSHRLVGFDSTWSDWEKVTYKEYTNLREGNYTFQIRAVNAYNSLSEIESFDFTIKPPFFRSRAAYSGYFLIIILIIAGNFLLIRNRILRTRMREKLKHEKRLARREELFKEQTALSEKEIMLLRNTGLVNEMKFKNKELANATLHLIRKNKTLNYLKEDLNKLSKATPAGSPAKETINNLLKKINRDLRNEKNWELFNTYFDEVHQDFIARLRDRYKDLSPKELRLCSYLRMNISTKEIAPLMNISVRGVEISRYRLRKKLDLDQNVNLTEFIMEL